MNKVIKMNAPNDELIAQLERLLNYARKGELRSLFYVAGWQEQHTSHGWTVDQYYASMLLLGELSVLQSEAILNAQLQRSDSLIHEENQ